MAIKMDTRIGLLGIKKLHLSWVFHRHIYVH